MSDERVCVCQDASMQFWFYCPKHGSMLCGIDGVTFRATTTDHRDIAALRARLADNERWASEYKARYEMSETARYEANTRLRTLEERAREVVETWGADKSVRRLADALGEEK